MKATAFARARQPTASGTEAHEGIVASEPRVLPLGTRIHIASAGSYNENCLVADTGAKIVGRHIDVYVPSRAEARQFGTKVVRVQIRQVGMGKADACIKDNTSPPHLQIDECAISQFHSASGFHPRVPGPS